MTEAPDRPRSTFVSAVAWVFIGLSAFASLIGLMQNLMVHLVFPLDEMQAQMFAQANVQEAPWVAQVMVQFLPWVFGAVLALSVVSLAISIGLLRRHEWARIAFIVLMVFGVLWNVAGIGLQVAFTGTFGEMLPTGGDPDFDRMYRMFGVMQTVILAMAAVVALAFSTLFGWIAWRLRSPEIVAEFRA